MWNYVLVVLTILSLVSGSLNIYDSRYALDRDLYESVLDPEQCQRQLQYVQQNNSILLAQFIDSGFRTPKGILSGNFRDYGLYPKCLAIQQNFEDMSVEGKYCSISIPINQNVQNLHNLPVHKNFNFDIRKLQVDDETLDKMIKYEQNMLRIKGHVDGNAVEDYRVDSDSPLSNFAFELALCIPKVCTTQEAITGLLFNLTAFGINYQDVGCRLPNDKPWVPADYLAIVVISILGFLTLLSTAYDINHTLIKKKDPKKASELLRLFSAYTNCSRLVTIKPTPGTIECLDGIRVLAIYWVVVGHVFFVVNNYILNIFDAFEWIQSFSSLWIMAAPFTVDTFFMLSGLLLVYTTAGKFTANQLIRNLPLFYLNRLARMFPILAILILFEASFLNRLGDGPNWNYVIFSVQKCRTYWWSTLLHLQNYINPREVCLSVSWYLAMDVNLHILSPIILFWVLGRQRRTALLALATGSIVSLAIAIIYIYTIEFTDDSYFSSYYVNILTRSPPFFIGMFYGYFLSQSRGNKLRIPSKIAYLLTVCSILLFGFIIYCKYLGDQPNLVNDTIVQNTFDSFLRPAWGLALGWIIVACQNGYADPINWFLSLNIWKIPARITYAIYLFHMSFIIAIYSNMLHPKYFTVPSLLFDFMGYLAISHIVAFLLTALVDSPFATLFKILVRNVTKSQATKRKTSTTDIGHSSNATVNKNQDCADESDQKQLSFKE